MTWSDIVHDRTPDGTHANGYVSNVTEILEPYDPVRFQHSILCLLAAAKQKVGAGLVFDAAPSAEGIQKSILWLP